MATRVLGMEEFHALFLDCILPPFRTERSNRLSVMPAAALRHFTPSMPSLCPARLRPLSLGKCHPLFGRRFDQASPPIFLRSFACGLSVPLHCHWYDSLPAFQLPSINRRLCNNVIVSKKSRLTDATANREAYRPFRCNWSMMSSTVLPGLSKTKVLIKFLVPLTMVPYLPYDL